MATIVIVLAVLATGAVGSLFTFQSLQDWYLTLNLPSWTPSGQIIGIVWTVLYILIAIAGILAWKSSKRNERRLIFWIYALNLVLNTFWSYLFFFIHQIQAAYIEMYFFELTILVLIYLIRPHSRLAAGLLLPYAAWVAFATYLTYTVGRLN